MSIHTRGNGLTTQGNAGHRQPVQFEQMEPRLLLSVTAPEMVIVAPGVEHDPTAIDDSITLAADSGAVAIDVLANDTNLPDFSDILNITSTTQPANGLVEFTASGLTYEPDGGFNGTDTFTYTVTDDEGRTDTATVTAYVGSVAATANDDVVGIPYPTWVQHDVAVLDNDVSGQGALTITSITQPDGGGLAIGNDGTFLTFKPGGILTEEKQCTYTVEDGNGNTDTATVTFFPKITDVQNDEFTIAESDGAVLLDIFANDTDYYHASGSRAIATLFTPLNGSVQIIQGAGAEQHQADGVIDTGIEEPNALQIEFDPEGFVGDVVFAYERFDDMRVFVGSETYHTTIATVTVHVLADDPTAADDSDIITDKTTPITIDVLANDALAANDFGPLTITGVTQPADGTATFTAGDVTYTPTVGFPGTVTFDYTIESGSGQTTTATVTVELKNPPIANDDSATTLRDASAVTLDVVDNDTTAPDVDDEFTITSFDQPTNGTVAQVVIGDHTGFTYEPDADYFGQDTFDYTITDEDGLTDTATVTVTVDQYGMESYDDSVTMAAADGSVTIDALANDTYFGDPNTGVPLLITSVTQPDNGTATIIGGGTDITYDWDLGTDGSETFEYTATDSDGLTATATVYVTITSPVPDAVDDSQDTPRVGDTIIDILDNDVDVLGVVSITQPTKGTAVLNGDDTVTYTPDPGETGTTTFTYTVENAIGQQDTATVTLTLLTVPVANDDSATTLRDASPITIDVLANDTTAPDPGGVFTITSFDQPANGTVVTIGDHTGFTYEPDADYFGQDTFDYTITHEDGLTATATVTVTVDQYGMESYDDSVTMAAADGSVTIDALANDTYFGDPNTGVPLLITSVTQPDNGTATIIGGGTDITYDWDLGTDGSETFEYTATDSDGLTATATVYVTITSPVPDAVDDSQDTPRVGDTIIDILDNDVDVLGVVSITQPTKGTAVLNGDDTVTYTPDPGETGTTTFTYTVENAIGQQDTATVTLTLLTVPVANDDSATTLRDASPVTIDVVANDTTAPDPGEVFTITSFVQPANGTVAQVVIGDHTGFTYEPDADYFGQDTFDYTITDEDGLTDTATVTVTVDQYGMEAYDDAVAMAAADGSVTISPLANDRWLGNPASGAPLLITEVTQPANGTATIVNGGTGITYDWAHGTDGSETFTYTATDADGITATATIDVTITSPLPDAVDDSVEAIQPATVTIDVLDNDMNVLGIVSITQQPTKGTAVLNGDDTITYTPDADVAGTDTFTYTVENAIGQQDTATVTLTLRTTPDANDDAITIYRNDSGTNIYVIDNDIADPLNTSSHLLYINVVNQPANGTIAYTAPANDVDIDAFVQHTQQYITYTPDPGFAGEDTFTYTCLASGDLPATATVTVTVLANDPTAQDDLALIAINAGATAIDVLDNDSTGPDGVQAITITAATQPDNGTVVFTANTLTYEPDVDFVGTETFTYTITDEDVLTDTATVTIVVPARTIVLDAKGKATFFDANDEKVSVSLRGGGTGSLYFTDAGNADAAMLSLTGTGTRSSLTIKTYGRGSATTIGNIDVNGSLKTLNAKTTSLTGLLDVAGPLKTLRMDGLQTGSVVRINTSDAAVGPRDSLRATLGQVTDATLETLQMPIRSLTCGQWVDTDATANEAIIAPYIGNLFIRGLRARRGVGGYAGDFEADITLTDADRRGNSLASITAKGALGGSSTIALNVGRISANSIDSSWQLISQGSVKSVRSKTSIAGQFTAASYGTISCKTDFSASIIARPSTPAIQDEPRRSSALRSLRVGRARDASLQISGGVDKISAIEWLDTNGSGETIDVWWVRNFRITGARANRRTGTPVIPGNLNVDISASWKYSRRRTDTSIGKLSVKGLVDGSTLALYGDLASIRVGDWVGGGITEY